MCNTVLNSANGHVPGASATCTTNQTCTVCGTVLNEANGHTPGASATCTTAQTCVVCSAELTAAKGHTEVIDAAVAATCTTTGLTEGKHCSVCNEVLVAQNTVNALGHTETKGGTEAIHSKCSVCGTTISSTHSFTNNKTSSKCRTCTCGYVDTAHTYTKTKTSGTCRTCSDCGYKDTSHGNYTKNKTSSKCRTCGDCGYVDTAHGNYTYHATASKCRTCGDCGYVYTSHSGSCCSYCGYTSSVTWTKYSCTYVQGNGYTEDNSHVGETTSWLRLVLLYNEYIDKDNWDSSATTNYTCHGKSYTGTDWYFSSSYGYSPSGEIHFTSNDDLSSLRSKVIGAYVVNGNSGSDRVYRIDSISSYSVNFGTSYGGLDIDGTFTCVASATKAQDTYTKGSTSYGTYTVDAGANPESTGYIVDGSNTGSYCVMYQNGTYYYYVAS